MRQQQFDFEHAMNHGAGLFQVHAPPMEPNEDYKIVGLVKKNHVEKVRYMPLNRLPSRHVAIVFDYVVVCKNAT